MRWRVHVDFATFPTRPSSDLLDLATPLDGTNGFTIYGAETRDASGFSVSGAGDVNGDGFDDIIVGARGANGPNNSKGSAGESNIVFGKADWSGTPTVDMAVTP